MFDRIEIDLPYDRDIRALYVRNKNLLCPNVSAYPDAKVIVLWDIKRYEALPEQDEKTQERGRK